MKWSILPLRSLRPNAVEVGNEDWRAFTFQGTWADFGAGVGTCAFYKDSFGIVHLRGSCKHTAAFSPGSVITFLPTGYFPASYSIFNGYATGSVAAGFARVDVGVDGTVSWQGPAGVGQTAAILTFDGITFRTPVDN